jgi:hypothetical protein
MKPWNIITVKYVVDGLYFNRYSEAEYYCQKYNIKLSDIKEYKY